MTTLSDQLTKIDPDQRLLVLKGDPSKVWTHVFNEWEGVTHLVYEIDTSAYARERDEVITALATSMGITVIPVLGHTLYSVPDIIRKNGNAPTMTVAQWAKAAAKLPAPALPLPVPTSLPQIGPTPLPIQGFMPPGEWAPPSIDLNSTDFGGYRDTPPTCFLFPHSLNMDVPTPESLSLPPLEGPSLIPGGELVALARLSRLLEDKAWVAAFAKPGSSPAAVLSDFVEGEVWRSDAQGPAGKGERKERTGGSTFVLSMFLK
jgi:cryptochrome